MSDGVTPDHAPVAERATGAVKRRLERAAETGRRGLRAPGEDIIVAGLVTAPFATTFGIWLSWLTWWPNAVIWLAFALALGAGAAWVAGHRMEGAGE